MGGADPLPDLYQAGTVGEVEGAASRSGIELGSHTWSHVNLTAVPPEVASQELIRPLDWLEERGCSSAKHITYPYGMSSSAVEAIAKDTGYEKGLLVHGGLMGESAPSKTPFRVPRMNVPRGLSAEGLAARVSGVWPR
jgi:peptidoglycan/xylan/chitin deacetylase (PgdA/CDA1 family)